MHRPSPARPTRLILVRHGEVEEAARGRCVGRLDVGLSERGRRQAEALGGRLLTAGLAAVYASTSRRAIDTARPTAEACGLALQPIEDLCEVSFGALEGLTFEEVESRFPETWRGWMVSPATVRFPGGESLSNVQARVRRIRDALRARHAGETAVAFLHGGPIRALLGDAMGLPDQDLFGLRVPHASAVVLEWSAGLEQRAGKIADLEPRAGSTGREAPADRGLPNRDRCPVATAPRSRRTSARSSRSR